MNDFNLGYNAYIRGVDFDNTASMLWKRGWYAAERDYYDWWYSLSDKEKEMLEDKDNPS